MAINIRLLACKAELGYALYYVKPTLRVDPYFQVLALLSYSHFLLCGSSYIQIITTNHCYLN
jgi:hypothetical protein